MISKAFQPSEYWNYNSRSDGFADLLYHEGKRVETLAAGRHVRWAKNFRPLFTCSIEPQHGQVPMLFAQLVEGVLDEADVPRRIRRTRRAQAGRRRTRRRAAGRSARRSIRPELPRLEALKNRTMPPAKWRR